MQFFASRQIDDQVSLGRSHWIRRWYILNRSDSTSLSSLIIFFVYFVEQTTAYSWRCCFNSRKWLWSRSRSGRRGCGCYNYCEYPLESCTFVNDFHSTFSVVSFLLALFHCQFLVHKLKRLLFFRLLLAWFSNPFWNLHHHTWRCVLHFDFRSCRNIGNTIWTQLILSQEVAVKTCK